MKAVKLAASILIAFTAAGLGSIITTKNLDVWYSGLDKPYLNPPNWVFAPVWTVLYLMIGISLYLVWIAKSENTKEPAYIAFGSQLALNTMWSYTFFGLQLPWAALFIIGLLIAVIVWNIRLFKEISKSAAYLLVPYLLWVCFATYLTIGFAILN